MQNENFDAQLRKKIADGCEESEGRELTNAYEQTRTRLEAEVLPYIRGAEPSLSDHGPKHIENVQKNAILLLSDDGVEDLTAIEMYCLGMCILFHDAGNVLGRSGHQNKVTEIFDSIRGDRGSLRHEKTLVTKAARAHTGTAKDGSYDTLKSVSEQEHLRGHSVRLRELAAILRFADELAEGSQRTSDFMKEQHRFDPDSRIYHEYATSTNIAIQRNQGRIAVAYEIQVGVQGPDDQRQERLSKFLDFVYKRIIKLDQERRYACYYSKLLTPFKSTDVTFSFHCGSTILDTDLSPLKLTDIVVPGDRARGVSDIDTTYAIETLVDDVLAKCPSSVSEERDV